ncbi:alpha/beta hydrolase [Heyndrickxia shackletonii]|uniref:Alpha/beta hydrolase n=4 Tax=Heyndrickxia TaxID=2837504 RepID=A0A0Q3WZR0_9BACI|nr:alpha/beta hydrolase [Heyndrickxia shackletonii]NEY99413.1 alpha/beta hydrolase [Heyndrickxia shackletonii]
MKGRTIYKSAEGKTYIVGHYENYMQSFKFDVERYYIDTSYGKTHVIVSGPKVGKPIFIFQGGNCINPMTLSWFSSLTDEYRIYAPDTIGHPGYSEEIRISAKDHSFAQWILELMNHFNVDQSAFIGPSYGAGIILRLAAFMPNKIDCAILISPAGIGLGSKLKMMKDVLLPLVLYHVTSSENYLNSIAKALSDNRMKEIDKKIIGDIFKYTKLEQEMPKLTEKKELVHFNSPTLVISGKRDIFFPDKRINKIANDIIPNLIDLKSYDMGHFPSEEYLVKINSDIKKFLKKHN